MRPIALTSVMMILPTAILADEMVAGGQAPPTPPYDVLRFNENYSYLTNPARRTDWFDSVKYIPLRTGDPSWYATFGGELRERFEGNYNPHFGIGGAGEDSYLLQRATLLTDVHLGQRVRFFVEGISGLMEGESRPAPPPQYDPIDLQFAFLDVVPFLTDDQRLTLRLGRFGMLFGSGRLVAPRVPVNIDFRFDGMEWLYSGPRWEATAFLTQPVQDSGGFNGENHSTTFWGLYVTHWFDAPRQSGVDLYYLGIERDSAAYASGSGYEQRHSVGTRQFARWNNWDWNSEEILQAGHFGDDSILAWTASMDSGYTFDTAWRPRLGLKADVASGSGRTTGGTQETFDSLYFKAGYFNDASLLSPQNIINVHPNAGFQLTPALEADGGADVFWRYSRNDAIYGVPGNVSIPALKTASSYAGTALDLNLTWQVQRHITFQASYVHFFAGDYIRQAGGRGVDYVSTTLSFLF